MKSRECFASSLIYRPAGETHRERFLSKKSLCLSLDLGPQWMARFRPRLAVQNPFYFQTPHLIPISARLAGELQSPDSFSELVVESLLTEMLALTARSQFHLEHPYPVWLKRVLELLMSTPQPLRIWELAKEAGVHPVHLARVFRRYHGCTVGDYVRLVRIQQAQQDLLETNEPIAEIAIKNGFADQSHFTRSFKQVTGRTPARYRSNHF